MFPNCLAFHSGECLERGVEYGRTKRRFLLAAEHCWKYPIVELSSPTASVYPSLAPLRIEMSGSGIGMKILPSSGQVEPATLYCGCTIIRPSSPLYCRCTIESPPAPVVNVPLPTPPTRSLASRPKLAKSYPAGTRRPSFFGDSKTNDFHSSGK